MHCTGFTKRKGSSPLTRGAPLTVRGSFARRRLIPAHAGSTSLGHCWRYRSGAHPRSRGEHGVLVKYDTAGLGSSPLTRGALNQLDILSQLRGLIPAHAGSTTACAQATSAAGAHPRSRGEHLPGELEDDGVEGSSPLTRGTHYRDKWEPWRKGLIPAHAGSTSSGSSKPTRAGAHPRSRGEHAEGADVLAVLDGLIPAHAGSTPPGTPAQAYRGAHPRSRGEHLMDVGLDLKDWGSSPLTRGARQPLRVHRRDDGLIPAHAGSTADTSRWRPAGRAHPRSRGEHSMFFNPRFWRGAHPRSRGEHLPRNITSLATSGSSPLTRGAPSLTRSRRATMRLIPAHAGSTLWGEVL